MDFLTKATQPLVDLFRSMTPAARITSALLLAVVMISVAYLVHYQFGTTDTYLFGGRDFSDHELDTMQAAFSKAGLNRAERVGARIRVPRSHMYEYLAALAQEQALPENFDTDLDAVLNNASVFESRQLREMRVRHAQQKKVARLISSLSGIEEATVQYDEQKKGGLFHETERTAVAAVRAEGQRSLSEEMIRTVRDVVCRAFVGLDPDHVTVTDLNSGRAYTGSAADGIFGSDNVYAAAKRVFEAQWQDKIYQRLSMFPGAVVAVNVELDPEVNHSVSKITYDPQATAVDSTSFSKTTDSGPAEGGRPGTVPNLVLGNTARSLTTKNDVKTSAEESREEQRSVTGHEQTTRQRAPLVPNRVTATIAVPKSYFSKVWHQEHPAVDGQPEPAPDPADLTRIETEVTKKIEAAVVGLLPPVQAGDDKYPLVTVSSYTDFPEPLLDDRTWSNAALAWAADNWQSVVLAGVGLACLIVLRGLVRSVGPAPAVTEAAVAPAAAEGAFDTVAESANPVVLPMKRVPNPQSNLREELTSMVKEDPDAAANVLRTWIGDAA